MTRGGKITTDFCFGFLRDRGALVKRGRSVCFATYPMLVQSLLRDVSVQEGRCWVGVAESSVEMFLFCFRCRTDIDTERPECDGISDLFNWRDVMREFVTCWPAHDDQASPRQRDSITSLVSLLPISCFFFAKVHLAVRGE